MAAFYRAKLPVFLAHEEKHILGALLESYQHQQLQKQQTRAWQKEIQVLKLTAQSLLQLHPDARDWSLILEYPIPRRQKRLDAVLLASDIIFCLEYKTEDKAHALHADRQVEEYALDLRDFHQASRGRTLIPIVVVPKALPQSEIPNLNPIDAVRPVIRANQADLAEKILSSFHSAHLINSAVIDPEAWDNSPYKPVPTIIEAAETLFAGHDVADISHHHAEPENLTKTSHRLVQIVEEAQREKFKAICFVTGVPGAGKTLAGLYAVHNPNLRTSGRPAGVFLSGNGPLVKIVSEALSRDHKKRKGETGGRTVSTFIQNVHVFVRESLEKSQSAPVEKIIVFDEAQRAWNAAQNLKKNNLEISEPETMIGIMDRHSDWAVLIALIGGGQEIHDGEAGLAEWGKALLDKFQHWHIHVSPKALTTDNSLAGHQLFPLSETKDLRIVPEPSLHLSVNLRSFQRVTDWVEAVLNLDPSRAREISAELGPFKICLTRSLKSARDWLQKEARGLNRCGLLASSGAIRLRADGIELSSGFRQGNRDMYVHWFLNQRPDVRSSNQLEVAASEFECQGLEIDWTGLCWGGDFRFDPILNAWSYRTFTGSAWRELQNEVHRRFLLNTYRVLMTRARKGMIIWVPTGNSSDPTRSPSDYDPTANYLSSCGATPI